MTAFFSLLARLAIRRRWLLLVVWVLLIGVAGVGILSNEHTLKVGGFNLPGTEFNLAADALARDLDLSTDKSAIVVFHSERYRVTEQVFYEAVQQATARLEAEPSVVKVQSFYRDGIPDVVSKDNRTTYAWVTLQGSEEALEELTPHLREIVRSPNVDVAVIGNAAANYDVQKASAEDLVRVERFTLPIVFVLLVLVFGSVVAAGIPILLGIAGVAISLALITTLARVTDISIFAENTASMIGLGLAIDFSLIMVSRYREELLHRAPDEALEATLQTSGRSILFSGLTLMLTMAVLSLFPVMVIRSIALAIAVVAGVAVISGLFLLPVVLAALGPRINLLDLRRYLPGLNRSRAGTWAALAHGVMRRPWLSLILSLVFLLALATPALWLYRIGVTVKVLPETTESRRAYELMERQFGPGEVAPLIVIVQTPRVNGLWTPQVMESVYTLHERLAADPRVGRVQSLASLIPNPSVEWMKSLSRQSLESNSDRLRIAERITNIKGDNTTTILLVYPKTGETSPTTVALLKDVRQNIDTLAPGLRSQARVLVGGAPAQHYDFDQVVYQQFPILLGLSLFVTFLLLLLFFHSLVLPIKAILLNIVSLLAAYGLLTLVFQFGIGDRLLGFNSLGAILSYTPVLLFSILFGLSTDYEVFVLTRVREFYHRGQSNEEAVAHGLERTAGVITAAGLIMIVVFGSFALTQVLLIKELGFGLAVAVLLDMTLVRLVLVPATMKLMGNRNWWLPTFLAEILPTIEEGDEALATAPALQGVPRPAGD